MEMHKKLDNGEYTFVLYCDTDFEDANVTDEGGTIKKKTTLPGGDHFVSVSHVDKDWDKTVDGGKKKGAIRKALKDVFRQDGFKMSAPSDPPPYDALPVGWPDCFSAFARHFQWPLIAMECVDYVGFQFKNGGNQEDDGSGTGVGYNHPYWDPPKWKLVDGSGDAYEGSNVKCGFVGSLPVCGSRAFRHLRLHPEFSFYKGELASGHTTLDSVFLADNAIWTEDGRLDELDPHGGVISFDALGDFYGFPQLEQRYYLQRLDYFGGEETTTMLSLLCGRGTGLVTDGSGVPNDGTAGKPQYVPGSKIPDRDGQSFIAAAGAHGQLGPYFGDHWTDHGPGEGADFLGYWVSGTAYPAGKMVQGITAAGADYVGKLWVSKRTVQATTTHPIEGDDWTAIGLYDVTYAGYQRGDIVEGSDGNLYQVSLPWGFVPIGDDPVTSTTGNWSDTRTVLDKDGNPVTLELRSPKIKYHQDTEFGRQLHTKFRRR